jgi:hypothetical protein
MAQVAEPLSSKGETLNSNCSTIKKKKPMDPLRRVRRLQICVDIYS